jgi:CRISPR-associated protein Cst2
VSPVNTQEGEPRKYIVMDIVFYGSSLNYDQGGSNYQELKKITKWDGRQYTLVSRYALRYSILHWANKLYPDKWKLGGENVLIAEEDGVARLKHPQEINNKEPSEYMNEVFSNYPEFDLFGFMSAPKKEKGEAGTSLTRISPVKISHAISLTPYNYDSHFMANLDLMRRAGGVGSNPVTIEEKSDFYVYNVVIDVNRIGKYTREEHKNDKIGDINVTTLRSERISQFIETIFNLKREIKGRMEDLSPWLVICGLYNNGMYETYFNKIELSKSHIYKVITKTKETRSEDGSVIKEIENETVEKDAPKFVIDSSIKDYSPKQACEQQIIGEINKFLSGSNEFKILIYKKQFVETEPVFEELTKPDKPT